MNANVIPVKFILEGINRGTGIQKGLCLKIVLRIAQFSYWLLEFIWSLGFGDWNLRDEVLSKWRAKL
jgi:hypothetical protein